MVIFQLVNLNIKYKINLYSIKSCNKNGNEKKTHSMKSIKNKLSVNVST